MITAMNRDAFISDAWEVVGRKVSKAQMLSDVYATAVSSVGLPVHPDSDAVRMFRLVLAEERSLIRQRDQIEAQAVELLSDLPDYQLLTTLPSVHHLLCHLGVPSVWPEPARCREFDGRKGRNRLV